MKALIDGDILLFEGGFSGEFVDKDTGEEVLLPADQVLEWVESKIESIKEYAEADSHVIYFTDSEWLQEQRAKRGDTTPFIPNFRYAVAKTKEYKGTRTSRKPFHFYNILTHLLATQDCVVSTDGLEADDMMCIDQMKDLDNSIICSRDKDLRICPGWHMSWECGKQPLVFPHYTDRVGHLEWKDNGDVLGYGLSFFYYQMLVGDTADNIPGLPKWGKKKAFKALGELKTEKELFTTVKDLYKEVMGEASKEYFLEQANLLWMVQEKGVGFEIPKF